MIDRIGLLLQPNPPELDARVEAAGRSQSAGERLPDCAATDAPALHGLDREGSDGHLVALARSGDDSAFEAIVDRYQPLLLRHCRDLVGDDAQDAVQQALVDAWRALRRGCDVRDLRPWLFTIAHRAAVRSLRQRGERCVELPESLVGGRSSVEQVEQSVRTRAIFAAIADLPDAEQEALVSMSVQGRTGCDTATALGVSEGTVRQLVFRARTRVRAAVRIALPPVSVFHRLAIWSSGARRSRAFVGSAPSTASSPTTIGMLAKVGAVVAAGFVIGAPVAALSGHQTRSRVPAMSDHAAEASSIPAARATPTRTRHAASVAVLALRSHERPRTPVVAPAPGSAHERPPTPVAAAPGSGAITQSLAAGIGVRNKTPPGRSVNAGSYRMATQLQSATVPIARQFREEPSDSASQVNGDVTSAEEAVARVVQEVPTSPPGLVESQPAVVQVP